jgi:hypothetical protein
LMNLTHTNWFVHLHKFTLCSFKNILHLHHHLEFSI